MLEGLLGRGFSSKCKSLIKTTRARIEVVRRRAEAKQRFLKEDLSRLLSNGLDINAYGRTEEFLAGLNLLSCYDFIEQTCEYIVKQLSRIEKQGECPEECREAVSSLMFAAARFSDLPELRDLRNIFQRRYGNSLESFVNRKFCEKLSVVPPARAKRLQVLHDITSEFSIKWDSKGFEQRMGSTSVLVQVDVQKADVKQRGELLDAKDRIQSSGERNVMRRDNSNDHIAGSQEMSKQAYKSPLKKRESSSQESDVVFHGRQTSMGEKHSYTTERYDEEPKQVQTENSSHRKMKNNIDVGSMRQSTSISHSRKGGNRALTGNKHAYPTEKGDAEVKTVRLSNYAHRRDLDNWHNNGICNSGKGENSEAFSHEKGKYASSFGENLRKNDEVFTFNGCLNQTKPLGSMKLEEESDRLKSCTNYALLPPYVKPKDVIGLPPPYTKPNVDKRRTSRVSSHVDSEQSINLSAYNISDAVDRSGQTHKEPDENVHGEQFIEPANLKSYRHEKEFGDRDDKVSVPKPRSTRRKHHKSSSGNDIVGSCEDGYAKRRSSSRRKDHSRKGLQMILDEEHHKNNEEEMLIDELLIHYCKIPSSYDGRKLKNKVQAQSSHRIAHDASKMAPVPTRSISLPREPVAFPETKKAFNRSNTFQPDNQARHVHPKLPDYDDLAEQFAALKGR